MSTTQDSTIYVCTKCGIKYQVVTPGVLRKCLCGGARTLVPIVPQKRTND